MANSSLTPLQRQIYWSAPSPVIERGRRRTAFGLLLVLGVERLLREGRLRGPQARLAMAQAQAARLLAAPVTGAAWKTRRGDVLRHEGDELAAALVARAIGDETDLSAGACLIASCDLLDEICDWLADGQLVSPRPLVLAAANLTWAELTAQLGPLLDRSLSLDLVVQ